MGTSLPAAVEFRLPAGWAPGPEQDAGTFVALHAASAESGFPANITVDTGIRPNLATLAEIAAESVAALRERSPDLTVTSRGAPADPGLAQDLRLTVWLNGRLWEVIQSQVYLAATGSGEQTVLRAVLTSTVDQFARVHEDFVEFLSTLRFASD